MDSILQENLLRLIVFVMSFAALILVSYLAPLRKQKKVNKNRILSNLSLGALSSLIFKIFLPFSLMQLADYCSFNGWGLINNIFKNGGLTTVLISVLLLDFLIYWQHRVTHIIPLLWRLHAVHHSDIEQDTTSAIRFHPLEIILSYIIKAGFIVALGLPALSVFIFEIILSTSSLFNHSNFSFPKKFESYLRYFIVTPTMHRIHHSTIIAETNSNYSFSFSIWDRLFSSFTKEAKVDQEVMEIGLAEYRETNDQSFINLILQPFKNKKNIKP